MLPRYHSGKEFTSNAGDEGSLSGSGRSPGEGHSNPLQYSCLVDYSPWNCRVRLQQQRRYICITESICHHLKRCKPTIKDGKTYIRNSLNKTLQDSNDLEIVWRPVCEFWQKCRSNWQEVKSHQWEWPSSQVHKQETQQSLKEREHLYTVSENIHWQQPL